MDSDEQSLNSRWNENDLALFWRFYNIGMDWIKCHNESAQLAKQMAIPKGSRSVVPSRPGVQQRDRSLTYGEFQKHEEHQSRRAASTLIAEQQEMARPKLDSVVGVILSFSTLHDEEMVDFFVYNFKQRRFSHMVKILRTKFPPDSCQPGGWYRLLFHPEFDIIGHLRSLMPRDGQELPVLIPKRAVICQRRLSTRLWDEKVMFFVNASYTPDRSLDGAYLYKCRLGMLKLTRAQLTDEAGENCNGATANGTSQLATSNSENIDADKREQPMELPGTDELPQRLKLWILPSGAGDVCADGFFHVNRIDARIWISNEPDSDSDGSSINGDATNCNNKVQLSASFSTWFDELVTAFHKENRMSDARRQSIDHFVAKLQDGFRTETNNQSLEIKLFGSVLSGFGSNNCDIDLCLVNTDITRQENSDGVIAQEKRRDWLNRLVHYLRKNDRYTVVSVVDARTPIVKFEHHGEDGFHGDISVENGLALHNTELLRLYTCFDERVSPLGFAVKRLAKLFGINDASAGSISSYAYIVMLIHFLQTVDPPVLPYLQNNDKGQSVEGWNVSFARQLPEQFANKNTQSIAQLFHDFLCYYAFEFDVHTQVAQMRTSEPYSKRLRRRELGCGDEQQFRLCVEDPFDLQHNLTSGVRHDTLHYIIKCFRSAIRGMVQFDTRHFVAKDEAINGHEENNTDNDAVASATKTPPKMTFDELMRPFKPRRVVRLNNNKQNQQQQQQPAENSSSQQKTADDCVE